MIDEDVPRDVGYALARDPRAQRVVLTVDAAWRGEPDVDQVARAVRMGGVLLPRPSDRGRRARMEPQLAPLTRYRVRQLRRAERLVVEPVSLEEARLRWWMSDAGGSSRERWARVPQRIVGTERVPVSFAIGGPWWDRFVRTLQPGDTLQVTWSTERLPADTQPPATGIERALHLAIDREGKRAGEVVANLATGSWSFWPVGSRGER